MYILLRILNGRQNLTRINIKKRKKEIKPKVQKEKNEKKQKEVADDCINTLQ